MALTTRRPPASRRGPQEGKISWTGMRFDHPRTRHVEQSQLGHSWDEVLAAVMLGAVCAGAVVVALAWLVYLL